MLVCECGYSAPTKKGMQGHQANCNTHKKKCVCGYESKWKSHFDKHTETCKKKFYNPKVNYIFEPHPETIDQMAKHQFNMVQLLDESNSKTYGNQFGQVKLLNEIKITTKYIKQWKSGVI